MLSARNQFQGVVKSVKLGGVMAEVIVTVGNLEFVSAITRSSAESLALKPGTTSAQLKTSQSLTTSQENPLSPNLENAQDPDLGRLLEAWGKMDPKLKRVLLAALEPDRPGT
jgi:molybdopterin-binding protein